MPAMQEARPRGRVDSDGWVEHWLDRYCTPGEHRFRPLDRRRVACDRCGKHKLIERSTCIFCEIPGEHAAVMAHLSRPSAKFEGELCGTCLQDFQGQGSIRGWSLTDAR
ncbi:MAG: hypothetical protein U0837_12370 [Dehalococcoidia bacterium]|jgi:hypothetical protein